MAIEAGWDPEAGPPLSAFVPPDAATLAWWAQVDATLPEPVDPGEGLPDDPGLLVLHSHDESEDEPDHALGDEPVPPPDAEPDWTVPGVSEESPDADGGVSADSQALLEQAAEAARALRLASAGMYRSITAIRRSDVLAETRYRKLSSLLEDHVRLDPRTVTALERQAAALHEAVTPTGATIPAELPATAAAVDDGLVGDGHVEIIRTTMQRLRAVPDLAPVVLDTAEEQLAGLATTMSPRQLATAAKVIADRLDPDGALPDDDQPAGNELHYTKRRNGQLTAKLVLREPAAAALFDDAVRAATPAPAAAVVADPETGLPPVADDGRDVGADPRREARSSKPHRQAHGLLDLISASHRAGLDHPEAEQHAASPTASMPLPDLDDDADSCAWTPEPAADDTADDSHADVDASDEDASGEDAGDSHEAVSDEATEDDESPVLGAGQSDPDPEPPPRGPWTPPDPAGMSLPGRERVTLTVTLDYETLRQQLGDTSHALALLGDSTWIRSETVRRLACDADVIPMVLGSKGEVLDVGRKTRSIPTATGRAVIQRDRHCAFPGCRRRARTSEIHHVIHWADHGETEPDNLVCLCRYHHDLVHHSGWDVIMVDHLPWFRPPRWLDPTRTLRHNRPWQTTVSAGPPS